MPVRDMYGCIKDGLILITFRLPQISCFTLSLKYFCSDSDNCPSVGTGPLFQFPHQLRAGPVLLTLLFFPSSFVLPSFVWLYMFFSTGQVLLSALSWRSACTSVSEGVFLMYPVERHALHNHLLLCHLVLPCSVSESSFLNKTDIKT